MVWGFLTELFHSINRIFSNEKSFPTRSTMSVVIVPESGSTFGNQPIVKRLMKGVFGRCRRYHLWCRCCFYLYLSLLSEPAEIVLKELSYRLDTLLCILSRQRSQTLGASQDNEGRFPELTFFVFRI